MGSIELQRDMAEQQYRAIVDVRKDVLHNIKADVQQIHNARFKLCTSSSLHSPSILMFFLDLTGIFKICGVSRDNENPDQSLKERLISALNALIGAVKTIPRAEREMRTNLMERIESFSEAIPNTATNYFSPEQRDALAAPLTKYLYTHPNSSLLHSIQSNLI